MHTFGHEVSEVSLLASINATYIREDDLDDGVVALGKFLVCRPDLANSARGIPTHISVSEKLKESIDK